MNKWSLSLFAVIIAVQTGSGQSQSDHNVISVSIAPPIALSFHCQLPDGSDGSAVPCDAASASDDELQLIASVVEGCISKNQFQLFDILAATEIFNAQNEEGVEYEGVELAASLSTSREVNGRDAHVRTRVFSEVKSNVILLSGAVYFTAPSDPSITLPSEEKLSHLLQTALIVRSVDGETGLVHRIRSLANDGKGGGGGWLERVIGYDVSIDADLMTSSRRAQETTTDSQQDTSENDGESSSSNILLIVGAAGATCSLLLVGAVLCYAKKSYDDNGGDKSKKANEDVKFQPGMNNPRSPSNTSGKSSSSKLFKKKSSRSVAESSASNGPPAMSFTNEETRNNSDDDDEDDEEFRLAREALNTSAENESVGDSLANNTYGEDMSFAFTVDEVSLNQGGKNNIKSDDSIATEDAGDAMIGAGGVTSIVNDKGVFRWNADGTKMVYTPALEKSRSGEQNGFVFDEHKKKWVVKNMVVGEKNVSFNPSANVEKKGGSTPGRPSSVAHTRSYDSENTGVTGLTNFTYDDIALDNARRSRSAGTEISGSTLNASLGAPPSPMTPSSPKDQGVEVPIEAGGAAIPTDEIPPSLSYDSDFAPDTTVDRFMRAPGTPGGSTDDDSAALSGFTDFSTTATFNPTKLPPPRAVTPDRVSSYSSGNSDLATMATFATGDPGRIVPKKAAGKPNRMKIAEDLPFDEDIPFDERVRSRSGRGGVVVPSILDDDQSESSESIGSANSEQVLEDLNKLSQFMMERKRSEKSQSSTKGSSSRDRRKGGGGSRSSRGLGRKSSFGRTKYSDPNRGI